MRHRWANTALLVLILLQVVTGSFGLASGYADRSAYLWLHNTGAFAIAVVLIWKTTIAVRSLERPRAGRPRLVTLLLALMLVTTLTLGFTWPLAGYWDIAGFSGINLHIWLGYALTPFLGYHAWRYTRSFKTGYDADRRTAAKLFGLGGAGVLAWLAVESVYSSLGSVGAGRRFTGSYERRSFSGNAFPTTSWINDDPASISRDEWTLKVVDQDGGIGRWQYADLLDGFSLVDPVTVEAKLDCTSGWYSTQVWTGPRLLSFFNPPPTRGAHSIEVRSITGYSRRFSLEAVNDFILATHVGEEPLSHRHGAPLRLVAPGRRGFEWVKWVTEIRLHTSSPWLQWPFPLE